MIDKAGQVKFTYIPFKSGAEAAVQLAGGHIDSHVNNPSESIGQWKGSTQRPLCAFSPQRLPDGPKVTQTQNWHDVPTCVESGLDIAQFQQPRTVWLPGKVTADQIAFYVDLMKKVQNTPEWKEYVQQTSQTDTVNTGLAVQRCERVRERVRRAEIRVPERPDQQQPKRGVRAREVAQQRNGRAVGPMQVVQHEHDGRRLRRLREELAGSPGAAG